MNSRLLYVLLSFLLAVSFAGCNKKTRAGDKSGTSAAKSAPVTKTKADKSKKQTVAGGLVARIVFVGQKDACHCTHDRIDASWEALQAVLDKVKIPVERIQWDVDRAAAERYTKLRSPMVLPGIYFLDDDDKLIELLQGKVTEKQITKIIR
ncbi:MAG TPA: hypothetical protein VM425_19760 [Myxococcota bacterium]|nr:hypothetical protein [Myxococcota bacterium]